MRYEVTKAVKFRIVVFRVMTSFNLVDCKHTESEDTACSTQ